MALLRCRVCGRSAPPRDSREWSTWWHFPDASGEPGLDVCPGCYPEFAAHSGERFADMLRWFADEVEAVGVPLEQQAELDDALRDLRETARGYVEDAAHAEARLTPEDDDS